MHIEFNARETGIVLPKSQAQEGLHMEIGVEAAPKTSKAQLFGRLLLGLMLFNSGVSHLTYLRLPFQAQVPPWVPLNPDLVVVLSGCVEIILGLSHVALYRRKAYVGIIAALFFVAVFPGNIAQYTAHRAAFGLETDTARLARLFFQPVLVAWALWSTGAWTALRQSSLSRRDS
jgi:uncharacterized membrane protein